jgi:hypothetical protein|tara:strand:+ start:258 stop:581 length:324 start_codon:yes stop_codon:yes gene_type:complete
MAGLGQRGAGDDELPRAPIPATGHASTRPMATAVRSSAPSISESSLIDPGDSPAAADKRFVKADRPGSWQRTRAGRVEAVAGKEINGFVTAVTLFATFAQVDSADGS